MKFFIVFFIALLATLSPMASSMECSLNFKEFHSPFQNKLKKFKKIKSEIKDAETKTLTQEAILKTGEKILFVGGGCTQVNYSFIYSNLKIKGKKNYNYFVAAKNLLGKTEVKKEYEKPKEALLLAISNNLKRPVKKNKENFYNFFCKKSICSLDLSKKNFIKLTYSASL